MNETIRGQVWTVHTDMDSFDPQLPVLGSNGGSSKLGRATEILQGQGKYFIHLCVCNVFTLTPGVAIVKGR